MTVRISDKISGTMSKVLDFFINVDRRWVFLLMGISVMTPLLSGISFPEIATPLVEVVFDEIENIPSGSKILMAWDFDPGSAPELEPMATAWARHCASRGHKLYFMGLWPLSAQMIQDTIENVIKPEFPDMVYGEDYCNLGYKPGYEGVINVIVTDLKKLYTTDHYGTNINAIPMTRDIVSVQSMDLILNVSAGYPGTKEWVQYAAGPYHLRFATGCTGVQAPLFYPYIPDQMFGMLGAIKGAAEYESLLRKKYPRFDDDALNNGIRRMAPQLFAHILILGLIVAGNVIYFMDKRRQSRR